MQRIRNKDKLITPKSWVFFYSIPLIYVKKIRSLSKIPTFPAPRRPYLIGDMNIFKNDCQKKKYFLQRIKKLGLTENEANQNGLFPDEKGNILQQVRTFNNEPRQYIPNRDFKRLQQAQKLRSTFAPLHRLQYHFIKRLHPDYLRKNPQLPKYLNPKGQPAFPIPTRRAIANFKTFKIGGTIIFTEGYFKCVAMDLHGLESCAFTGITQYQIKSDVREYLLRRKPDRLVMLYDADALLIKEPKKNTHHSSRRLEDFCSSATRFSAQFFDLRNEHSLPTQLVFAMVNPQASIKESTTCWKPQQIPYT